MVGVAFIFCFVEYCGVLASPWDSNASGFESDSE